MEVMKGIKNSIMLQEFLESAEKLQEDVSDDLIDMIEEENNIVGDKILQSKFAYMVIKHRYYDRVNEGFEKFNQRLKNEIIRIKQLEDRIVKFKPNTDTIIQKHLRDLLSNIIEIDQSKPVFQQEESKIFAEGEVTSDSLLTFQLKGRQVNSIDVLSQKITEIEQLHEVYHAKLLPLSNQSLLVLGG